MHKFDSSRRGKYRHRISPHALIDALEPRCLLQGAVTLSNNGTLSIVGSSFGNVIDVRYESQNVVATRDGQSIRFGRSGVKRLFLTGLGGDDSVFNRTNLPATLFGGAGNDTLRGGSAGENLNGGRGADVLSPGDGGNTLVVDSADAIDYARLSGRHFEITVTVGAANEAVGVIRHAGNVDQLVCVDANAFNIRLTDSADAAEIFAQGDYYPENPVRLRVDMAGGDDTLLRGIGDATTVLGSAGNDAFLLKKEFTRADYYNSVAFRDGGPGDDYFEAHLDFEDFTGGPGFDTVSFSDSHNTGLYIPDVSGEAERYVSDGVNNFVNRGDAIVALPDSYYSTGGNGDTIVGAGGEYSGGAGDDVFLVRNGVRDSVYGFGGNDHADADPFDYVEGVATTGPRPELDHLTRIVLPATPARVAVKSAPPALLTPAGTLVAAGTSASVQIQASQVGNQIIFKINGREVDRRDADTVARLWIDGGDGNDSLRNQTALPATLVGGAGNDTLADGGGDDLVIDLNGQNTTRIHRGKNRWRGNFQTIDYRDSTADRNFLVESYPYNVFTGGLRVERGDRDADYNAEHTDLVTIYGSSWFDVRLTAGPDTVVARSYGEEGYGGSSVTIDMGEGDDILSSADLDDYGDIFVKGGPGNDRFSLDLFGDYVPTIDGGSGMDTATVTIFYDAVLPKNIDKFIILGGSTDNPPVVNDGDGSTVLDASRATGAIAIRGNGGDDTIIGTNFSDNLDGGNGNDRIEGRAGDDTLTGGSGRDRLFGGSGSDRFLARDRQPDFLDGGAGIDTAEVDLDLDTQFGIEGG